MNTFDDWYKNTTYVFTYPSDEKLAISAFNAGMERAAEIAESSTNEDEAAFKIRKEIK